MRFFNDSDSVNDTHNSDGIPPNTEMNTLIKKIRELRSLMGDMKNQIIALDPYEPAPLPSERGVWKQGTAENSVWIDLTKSSAGATDLLSGVTEKFKECVNVKLLEEDDPFSSRADSLIFEIILKTPEEVASACQQKATICGEEFEVSPAISKSLQKVKLSNIPDQKMSTLVNDLRDNLGSYGRLVYAIVETTIGGRFFNGRCTVYLDTSAEDEEYKDWTHKLEWKGSKLPAYARWYPSPGYCRTCHGTTKDYICDKCEENNQPGCECDMDI